MTRTVSQSLRVCAGLAAILACSSPSAPDASISQESTHTAYVTVLDDKHAPVTGLTPADLVIMENDTARPVTEVVPAADPLVVALLVDTAQPPLGTQAPIRDLRTAVTKFVTMILASNPESQIGIMETGGAAVLTVKFTNRLPDLTRGIGRLIQTQRTSAVVLEAIQDISKTISTQAPTRRAIVSIDFDSHESSRINEKDFSTAVQPAGAAIWAVSVRGSGGSSSREAVLDWATELTGGMRLTVMAASALEAQMQIVAAALTSQYRVTFKRPAETPVGDLRAAATRGSKFLVTRSYTK